MTVLDTYLLRRSKVILTFKAIFTIRDRRARGLEKRKRFFFARTERTSDKHARDKRTTRPAPSADPKATSQWRRSLHSSRAPSLRGTFCLRRRSAHAQTHARQCSDNVRKRPRSDIYIYISLSLALSLSHSRRRRVTHGRHAALDNKLERNGKTPIPRVLAQGKRHGGGWRVNEDSFAVFTRVFFAENQTEVVSFCLFKKYSRKDTNENKGKINENNAANSDFIRSNDRTLS